MIVSSIENTSGRVYVLGDLGGQFDALSYFIEMVDLDPKRDKIILNGNFIGYSPASRQSVAWLSKPWIVGVLGVNELGVLNKLVKRDAGALAGQWLVHLTQSEKNDLRGILESLPIALECSINNENIVVSHAPLLKSCQWMNTKKSLLSFQSGNDVFSLFGNRVFGLELFEQSSEGSLHEKQPLSVSTLSLDEPVGSAINGQYFIMTGSALMNHGERYDSFVIPFVELTGLTDGKMGSVECHGQLVIEKNCFQMRSCSLRER